MKRNISIVQAIQDSKLFGSLFACLDSWVAWLVWLKAVFGLPMTDSEVELYRQCTSRTDPPSGGVKEAYAIVGRRGGKSRIVSVAAVYIACFHDFRRYLSAGERGMVLILARDRDQARVVFHYIRGILESIPVIKSLVVNWRADEIELNNRIVIAVTPLAKREPGKQVAGVIGLRSRLPTVAEIRRSLISFVVGNRLSTRAKWSRNVPMS